jgi:hypothetical protein
LDFSKNNISLEGTFSIREIDSFYILSELVVVVVVVVLAAAIVVVIVAVVLQQYLQQQFQLLLFDYA